ncbi:MAG: YbaK/EbsC family protein [Lachnospiraceae bacterium]|jgi:prolyl-tRNA editing enzyme YbaK/EbsC (Cys-tRNA(Pro) deacylase)|nr:YbaK/EbsC family protein [Lachnospiraceae bacterium]
MSVERAKKHLARFGADVDVLEFDVSSATVALAAEAIGCEGARIAKSMSFLVDGAPVLVVAAGDVKIDNQKFKAQFHTKAKMIPPEDLETLVGHAMGGVCPFGVADGVKVYMDESLRRFETVYPAAGSGNSAIELTLPQLEEYGNSAGWVDVCKSIESGAGGTA